MTTRSRATSRASPSSRCSARGWTTRAAISFALFAAGCQPNFGATPSEIAGPRILAVRADPAEAAPGAMVTYSALTVYGDNMGTGEPGPDVTLPIDWAFCNLEKPLSDLSDISANCFTYPGSNTPFLVEIASSGASATAAVPAQACSLFGPDVPPAMNMMPPGRPADPDPTGGYYQPVRLILATSSAPILVAEESRILCGLPGATASVLTQFRMEYQPNTNPVLAGLDVASGGTTTPLPPDPDDGTGQGFPVKAGSKITLRASWPACPGPAMQGCGAETYPYYDPLAQTITMQREALTVSWYATSGTFDSDQTGRASSDPGESTDNGWTAPSTPPMEGGAVLVWVVLRDDRGGVAWRRYRLTVT